MSSRKLLLLLLAILPITSFARTITIEKSIYWNVSKETVVEGKISNVFLICSGCHNDGIDEYLPEITEKFRLQSNEYIRSARLIKLVTAPVEGFEFTADQRALVNPGTPAMELKVGQSAREMYGMVSFLPLISKNGRIEEITSYVLEVETAVRDNRSFSQKSTPSFASNSVLSTGIWYKIGVHANGMYRISYRALKNQGIDVDNIDPRNIAMFGSGCAMLPRKNSEDRPDDLVENAIRVIGETDGKFDPQDYIVFYGESPHKWRFDSFNQLFKHRVHEYSDTAYYFIRIGGTPGKRISTFTNSNAPDVTVNEFNDFQFHENDRVNLLKSGDDWLGEVFDVQTTYTFPFNFPNIITTSPGHFFTSVATASKVPSTWNVNCSGTTIQLQAGASSGGYGSRFARGTESGSDFTPSGSSVNVVLTYNKPAGYSSARGWLDFIEVNVRRKLIMTGQQMEFRDVNTVGNANIRYALANAKSLTKIWDISDPKNIVELGANLNGTTMRWVTEGMNLHTFIATNNYDSSFTWHGNVENQNLHAESGHDYIMISHSRFLPAAERLKAIHEQRGLSVVLTTPQMIYNEFSSGAQDIVALRDFIRMFYVRGLSGGKLPKYVLFMGDGSYDNKHRLASNTNFIPTFESNDSYHASQTYVSDDFFCLLDTNEGEFRANTSFEMLDVGIGRIPVQTADQANKIVDKIERYLSVESMGDWRNMVCFVGDDEDHNVHMEQANDLSHILDTAASEFNQEKIFLDAYKQYATPGGQRYPDVQESLKRQVERGALVVSYTGHGGEVGWAHERILNMADINGWSNRNNLPLFLTATCEFSRWDDPQRTAGGEVVLTNPTGGGIGLLTTVRLVYSGPNFELSKSFFRHAFDFPVGQPKTLGEIFREVKNENLNENARNFSLLGDPGLTMHYPAFNVVTDSINGQHVTEIDTVGALGLVTIKGHLEDYSNQQMTNFNGTLYPTVFDKRYEIQTQNNDDFGPFNFSLQNKRLFRGKASVKNGEFEFQFIVPKDIAYNFGAGRISYYADNKIVDANGLSNDFVVGGTDKNAPDDKTGPQIELYMNDENFVYGGITDENPIFLAKVFDEHGINMAGTGIGHDISAILDGKTDQPIVMNDYYSADIDSYQSGRVNYPFEDLSPGPHKLTLKVWDVYNNSTEATIEFVVQEYKDISLNRVLNYPNPFTTNTSFWFEHNQPNTVLDVNIQIYTISGKIVNTIEKVILTEGYSQNLQDPINWNGRDRYGDKLGRGVYIYKLQVRSRRNGTTAEKIEKLVIL